MNVPPMMRRFFSGSSTPCQALEKARAGVDRLDAEVERVARKCITRCASSRRSTPLSTKMQVSWSPMARCTSAAATVESTPPLSPQTTPARADARADALGLALDEVLHRPVGAAPCRCGRRSSPASRVPRGVCTTSGWNWTPKRRRCGSAHAAIGELALCASTVPARRQRSACRRGSSTPACAGRPKPANRSLGIVDRSGRPARTRARGARRPRRRPTSVEHAHAVADAEHRHAELGDVADPAAARPSRRRSPDRRRG